MKFEKLILAGISAFAVVLSVTQAANAHGRKGMDLRRNGVFVLGNAPDANTVISFALKDGELTQVQTIETAGKGGAGGNQGALALDPERGLLFAVNAGSHTISTFEIGARALELEGVTPAEGLGPMSLASCTQPGPKGKTLVYALNEDSRSIAGFEVDRRKQLRFLPGSVQSISASTSAAAQILFDNTCSAVVVVERNPASFMLYPVDRDGVARAGKNVPSASTGQLGSAVTRNNQLFVSETGTSAASSFALDLWRTNVRPITQTLANGQAGSCWAVATRRTFRCDGWRQDCTMGYVMNVGTSNPASSAIKPTGQPPIRERVAPASMGSAVDGALPDDERAAHRGLRDALAERKLAVRLDGVARQ